jgi:hypothetical protein
MILKGLQNSTPGMAWLSPVATSQFHLVTTWFSIYNLVFNLEIDGLRPTRIVALNHYKQTAYFSRIRGELQAKNGADQ